MKYIKSLFIFAALVSAVFGDMTIVQTIKSDLMPGGPQNSPGQPLDSTLTMSIKGQKARIDLPVSQMSSIIDLKADKMYTLDHRAKRVMVMSLDAMKKAMNSKDESEKSTVTKTGKVADIRGYHCAQYDILGTGKNPPEIKCWITEDVDDAELAPFQSLGGRLGGFLGFDGVQKPKGMMIRSESKMNMAGRSVTSSTEVQSIKKDPVAEALFVLPADYQVMELPKFDQPPPRRLTSKNHEL